MAKDKKSFVLYSDQRSLIDLLSDEQAGQLLKHIYSYVNDEDPELSELSLKLAFEPIKLQLKRDLLKWDNQREQRSKAGKKSAESRQRKATSVNETERKATVNVNGNVTVNDNVIKDIDVKSIDFTKLLELVNQTGNRKYTVVTDKAKKQFKARIKEGYTKENIRNSIINAHLSDHHKEHGFKWLTLEFFSRQATLDQYGFEIKDQSVSHSYPVN